MLVPGRCCQVTLFAKVVPFFIGSPFDVEGLEHRLSCKKQNAAAVQIPGLPYQPVPMLPNGRSPPSMNPDSDCSVCAEGFSRGIAYSCRKCSKAAFGSAIGVWSTMAVVVLLVAAVLFKSLVTVVGDDTARTNDSPDGFSRSKCASFQDLAKKAFPISAIKIVVVVWQIVFQV